MSAMFFTDMLHQILDLKHSSDRHLQAPSGHIVEGTDDEHRFLLAIFSAGVQLDPDSIEYFSLFSQFHYY